MEVCRRTLIVSKGSNDGREKMRLLLQGSSVPTEKMWEHLRPTMTDAEPATPPAMRSCRAVTSPPFFSLAFSLPVLHPPVLLFPVIIQSLIQISAFLGWGRGAARLSLQ